VAFGIFGFHGFQVVKMSAAVLLDTVRIKKSKFIASKVLKT